MPAIGSFDPPARQNGRIANPLISQRSGGFLWVGRIFPTARICARMRARARINDTYNPPNPPIYKKQLKKPLSIKGFEQGGTVDTCPPTTHPAGELQGGGGR
jgi:hypothetical protein